MYKAIYRAYRPEVFEQVLGQEHILRILRNQVAAGAVSHAYLFCGTRGTGKTTIARLLAKAVNCTDENTRPCGHCAHCRSIQEGTFMDLIEIDAASNNGVENIRELRESVNYPPAVGRRKVYIMDEVHMLSTGAYNALLKTLEEPPEHVMFILCTTEPEKLPATILSRCVRMNFRRVSEVDLKGRLQMICADKGLAVEDSALGLIATAADGSVRDGLSILEQCVSGQTGAVSREDVREAIGTVGEEDFIALTEVTTERRVADGLLLISQMLQQGRDARQIVQGWMSHYRNLLLVKFLEDPTEALSMSLENVERVRRQAETMEVKDITRAVRELSEIAYAAKSSTQPRVLLEMALIKLATGEGAQTAAPQTRTTQEAVGSGPGASNTPAPTPPWPDAAETTVPVDPGEELRNRAAQTLGIDVKWQEEP